jgi:hypothetical protein
MKSIQNARAAYAPITKNQPGKGESFLGSDVSEVRIHNRAEPGQAGGF